MKRMSKAALLVVVGEFLRLAEKDGLTADQMMDKLYFDLGPALDCSKIEMGATFDRAKRARAKATLLLAIEEIKSGMETDA